MRAARALAFALDLVIGAALLALAGVLALAWLMVRTRAGAVDAGGLDAQLATALVLAAAPAWVALLAWETAVAGATPGQRHAGLVVEGGAGMRLLRLACHPLAATAWAWLAVVTAVATVPGVPLLLSAAAVVTTLGGLASAVLVLRRGDAPAVHDLVTGTRLVRA